MSFAPRKANSDTVPETMNDEPQEQKQPELAETNIIIRNGMAFHREPLIPIIPNHTNIPDEVFSEMIKADKMTIQRVEDGYVIDLDEKIFVMGDRDDIAKKFEPLLKRLKVITA